MARTALVLSGGAARGAYEVGVVRYLREELAKRLGGHVRFDILCGTSVGAINVCYLAATADDPDGQCRELVDRWSKVELDYIYPVGLRSWFGLLRSYLPGGRTVPHRRGGVLAPLGIERMVRRRIPWPRLHRNIRFGRVEALSVSATDVATGRTVVWVERTQGGVPPWSRDPRVVARPARIGPVHALASAALPLLFPAVEVEGRFYVDGGVKQNTPLSPALRLGADRVLVIRLRPREALFEPLEAGIQPFAHAARLLDSIFDDRLDYDLDRMRRFNALLDGISEALGESGQRKLEALSAEGRGQAYRRVREHIVQPSTDLAQVATAHIKSRRFDKGAKTLVGRALRSIGEKHGELVSYMLFDGSYAAELIQLGHEDARRQEEALARFFADETPAKVATLAVS